MRESEIQRAILDYLQLKKHFVWRNNTGGFGGEHKGKKWFVRAGRKGSADIIGCHRESGRMIAIEVKRPGNTTTSEQFEFLSEVRNRNGIAVIASSIDDVQRAGL